MPLPRDESNAVGLHCVIEGRVQAVGFRAFTVREARARGLTGWVRNRDDGRSVEVHAEGPRARLDELHLKLATGPPGAVVETISCRWVDAERRDDGFDIRR